MDIYNQADLDKLPKETVASWKNRIIAFALEKARGFIPLDPSGVTQKCVEATEGYVCGKISWDQLNEVYLMSSDENNTANNACCWGLTATGKDAASIASWAGWVAYEMDRFSVKPMFSKWLKKELNKAKAKL